ncbi:hypothetical protein [Endozoicomonas sp. SESOKO1]|uniref:hypothetical protein n=1 Tax=Endozoicomonas sp. SESOKO1 TaxID=2828742 RepID=UPI002148710D|nr:hypothetical protein [Endozoicomonas sp. SESOKO1]
MCFNSHITYTYGSMKSGKTQKLCNRVNEESLNGLSFANILVLKPATDTRNVDTVRSRASLEVPCVTVGSVYDVSAAFLRTPPSIVFIDETQFLSLELLEAILHFAEANGSDLEFFGLDKDYRGNQFARHLDLMNIADEVEQLYARCDVCGLKAEYSKLLGDNNVETTIIIGDEIYSPRCEIHFNG